MSAVSLASRKLSYKAPACALLEEACEDCTCGKAGSKSGSIWKLHFQEEDCASRVTPCNEKCTCERFKPYAAPAFKSEPCVSGEVKVCEGCTCGRAPLA
ncbi:hypothetical protein [Phaffia rhodozyma]|uniref:Uncharacterized protein n=1 Tax=Phaffia rhodozyma TaxID=264483 RepID=A0A0F7SS99_PHARH|nr:hypothetical protein [Phaffia rhodozyma]